MGENGDAGQAAVPLLILVQVLFGTLSIAGKLAIPQVGPLVLVAVRTGLAALVLVALERMLVGHRFERRDAPVLVMLSLLGVVVNQLLFLVGLSMTTAVEATVLITTIPVFTMALALALRRERWSARRGAGVAVAFAGVLLLLGSALAFRSASFLGNLLVVLNSASYAGFLVGSRPILARMPPLTVTASTFAIAAVLLLPVGLAGLGAVAPGKPDAMGVAAIAYIVVGPTVVSYFLVSHALVRVPASTVAAFIYLQPLVGVSLGALLLGEAVTPPVLGAAALILLGVALATTTRGSRRYAPAA